MKDVTREQMEDCLSITRAVGETLKKGGHPPVSAFVVAAMLVYGVAKKGALEPVLVHFAEVMRALDEHMKARVG